MEPPLRLTTAPVMTLAWSVATKPAASATSASVGSFSPQRLAPHEAMELVVRHPDALGVQAEHHADRVRPRDAVRPQADDADAVRSELGSEDPGERLDRAPRRAHAADHGPRRTAPAPASPQASESRPTSARSSAGPAQAVRKCDVEYARIGNAKFSAGSSTSGIPWMPFWGIPAALNETSMRPAFSTTPARCSSIAGSSRALSLVTSATPPAARISSATASASPGGGRFRHSSAPCHWIGLRPAAVSW